MSQIKIVHVTYHKNNEYWRRTNPDFSPFSRGGVEKGFKQAGMDVKIFDHRRLVKRYENWTEILIRRIEKFEPDIILISDNEIGLERFLAIREAFPDTFLVFFYLDQQGKPQNSNESPVARYGQTADLLLVTNHDQNQFYRYRRLGTKNVATWHSGADPDIYRPLHWNLHKCKYDLVFLGSNKTIHKYYDNAETQYRKKLIYQLDRRYCMKVAGQGWDANQLKYYTPRAFEGRANRLISSSIMTLGTQIHSHIAGSMSIRIWTHLVAGRLFLINYFKDIEKYFENKKHLVWFHDKQELFHYVDYYLNHLDEAKQIARVGRELILKHHTIKHRAYELLNYYTEWLKDRCALQKRTCSILSKTIGELQI